MNVKELKNLNKKMLRLAAAMYCFCNSTPGRKLQHKFFEYYHVQANQFICHDRLLEDLAISALEDYNRDSLEEGGGNLGDCHGYIWDIFYFPIEKALKSMLLSDAGFIRLVDLMRTGLSDEELDDVFNEMHITREQYIMGVSHYQKKIVIPFFEDYKKSGE